MLAIDLDFEGAKNIHVLKVLIWGFGGMLDIPDWGMEFYLNLNMLTGL